MKITGLLFIVYLAWIFPLAAQQNSSAGTAITFKVYGACSICKHRIEEAAKGKGVSAATWDIDSKQLSLVYNPQLTSLEKIQNRILAAGHDLETKKAKQVVYEELPACCHYREMNLELSMQTDSAAHDTLAARADAAITRSETAAAGMIRGVVMESNNRGIFRALPGASVQWLGSAEGVVTDTNGVFAIPVDPRGRRLVVSYTGYRSDTMSVVDIKELKIILATEKQLGEVIITSKKQSTYLSALNPVRTQIMTDRELFKAACCNLSESFETNPSVDVSFNDAITGSKQIQLLGLSGSYTQLTVENLPGPRGLATPWGLNAIPGPWVESIQLTKGIGSVANGYESIAGQINIELKKPESSETLLANAYINDFGKTDLNLNLAEKIGKKWSTALLLHDDFLQNKQLDGNHDGFRDLPTGNQFNVINRWKYEDGKGWLTQFGIKYLSDNRTGGQVGFNPSTDKLTTNSYGLGIGTSRLEGFGKIGYVFPEKKYKSIGLQIEGVDYTQHSYFGLTVYDASQHGIYTNLIYQSIIGSTIHKFRTGISMASDRYNENFRDSVYKRTETVPGAFFEYTFTPSTKFAAVGGIRADHDNIFGFFVTPRLHIRYEPVKGTTIRLSAGRGQRTANIFAENTSAFASARQVTIIGGTAGKAYGLNPEVAWNEGISVDQKFRLLQRDALFSVDYFRTDFSSQVVVDLENPRQLNFYNLRGKSYSNSAQVSLNGELIKNLEFRVAYRYYDVKTTYDGKLLEHPLLAAHRAFLNLAYGIGQWKFDYTLNFTGRKRVPSTTENPPQYRTDSLSPSYVIMNAQITRSFGKKNLLDVYAGAENLTNFFQKNPVLAADQPFSTYFDASLVWGPVTGRMFYAGLRYRIR